MDWAASGDGFTPNWKLCLRRYVVFHSRSPVNSLSLIAHYIASPLALNCCLLAISKNTCSNVVWLNEHSTTPQRSRTVDKCANTDARSAPPRCGIVSVIIGSSTSSSFAPGQPSDTSASTCSGVVGELGAIRKSSL